MLLAIALAGSGEISERNAKALLNDFIGDEDILAYVPNYLTQEQNGLRTAIDCVPAEVIRVRKGIMIDRLLQFSHEDTALIILGPEGVEDLVEQAQGYEIPVLDLTKGLFQHTGSPTVPLDGSESHADGLEDTSEGEPLGNESDLVRIDPVNVLPGLNDRQRKEVEEIVTEAMTELERRYFNGVAVDQVVEPEDKPQVLDPITILVSDEVEAPEHEPNYYRSKTGKMRPIGRSKARPGETAVYLTDGEINALPA